MANSNAKSLKKHIKNFAIIPWIGLCDASYNSRTGAIMFKTVSKQSHAFFHSIECWLLELLDTVGRRHWKHTILNYGAQLKWNPWELQSTSCSWSPINSKCFQTVRSFREGAAICLIPNPSSLILCVWLLWEVGCWDGWIFPYPSSDILQEHVKECMNTFQHPWMCDWSVSHSGEV